MKAIAKMTQHTPQTVQKYMRYASERMIDQGQAELMADVFPLVKKLYRARLLMLIKKAENGEDVSLSEVETLLKGLQIYDRPPQELRPPVVQPNLSELPPAEQETLAVFIAQRPVQKIIQADQQKVLDGEVQEVPSTGSDQA